MLIDRISEIDPTKEEYWELEKLAARFGIFNMTVVLMKVQEVQANKGGQMEFRFDRTTWRHTVATIISMAVLNFASGRHEKFSVMWNEERMMNFSRSGTPEEHRVAALKYLETAKMIIENFEGPASTGDNTLS